MALKKSKWLTKKNISLIILFVLSVVLLLISRMLSKPQITKYEAAGTARLFFHPSTTASNPLQKNANDTFSLILTLDPVSEVVSFVRFEILYDQTKLSVSGSTAVQINSSAFPVTFEGPILTPGKIAASVSVGNDPTKAVTSAATVATISFTALSDSGGPTEVRMSEASQILSIGAGSSATDNVLGSKESAFIQVGSPVSITLGPSSPITPTPPATGCILNLPIAQNVFGMAAVGSGLWISTTDGVARFDENGLQTGNMITGNGLDNPSGIALIGSNVWVVNRYNKTISIFNIDGTPKGVLVNLSDNRIPLNVRLTGIASIGQEIWITDEENGKIYPLDSTGSLIADPITHISLDAPLALAKMGNEIWVINSNYHSKLNSVPDIVRLDGAGAYLGSITNTGRLVDELPIDIITVGSEAWYLVNNLDAKILKLKADGSQSGVPILIKNSFVRKFTLLNNKIFILEHMNNTNKLRVYKSDGTAYSCTPTPTISGPTTPPPSTDPNRTTLTLNLLFHGIGAGGDSVNPTGNRLSNKNPIHQERSLNIQIVNEDNIVVATKLAPAFYNTATGEFNSHVVITDPIPEGDYIVKVKTEPYLRKLMPGFLTIKPGQKNIMRPTDLVTGDVNGDNTINVLDYNILYDCGYGVFKALPMINRSSVFNNKSCRSHAEREYADMNDNGTIDHTDYNLFVRELAVGFGQ